MKQFQMQDRRLARDRVSREATHGSADAMFPTHGPTVGAGNDAHAVGPQHIEFGGRLIDAGRLEIGIPRHLQVAVERLEQLHAGLFRVRPRQQIRKRMRVRPHL
jgi:hypothetical protein